MAFGSIVRRRTLVGMTWRRLGGSAEPLVGARLPGAVLACSRSFRCT
ncbi:hypothetical protein V6Z11_A06G031300 [Gossypium hirsutum]